VINVLYFHVSTFRSMCVIPNVTIFCSSLILCFTVTLLMYFLNDFEMIPVAPVITDITVIVTIIITIQDTIAIRYGLDGPGIESRWGRDFPHSSRPTLRPTQPPIQWVPGFFPGGKAAGSWR
jgi:hypothetical protein